MGLGQLILIYWNEFVMEIQLVLTYVSLSFAPAKTYAMCLINTHNTSLNIQLLLTGRMNG